MNAATRPRGTVSAMASPVLRMFFDRGVVFVPDGGKVLLSFHGEDADPVDLTADLPLLLEAGLVLLKDPSAVPAASSEEVDVATLEFPDRMRVYRDGRRLSVEEVGRAVEETIRAALRASIAAHSS